MPLARSAVAQPLVALLILVSACSESAAVDPSEPDGPILPPFGGTIFIDPDIITPSDPTTFSGIEAAGRGERRMFDRRVGWVDLNPYLFVASYSDSRPVEVQVNPEFGSEGASRIEAERYAEVIGRLPVALRAEVETVWIHQGVNPFGGGNQNLLIHTGQAALYVADGILEETLVHEAVHTSLDSRFAQDSEWLAAQASDPTFISGYASEFPRREDLAESFVPYLAVRYRADRISASLRATIEQTIPNRIAFFDGLGLNLEPVR